jgi:hypothetical protein
MGIQKRKTGVPSPKGKLTQPYCRLMHYSESVITVENALHQVCNYRGVMHYYTSIACPFMPPPFLLHSPLSPCTLLPSLLLLPTRLFPSPLSPMSPFLWKLMLCAPVLVVHSPKPNTSNASRMVSACIVVQLVI